MGSPPQVRGKQRFNAADELLMRITPAGAGKTGFALKNIFADWDHPRRCGENLGRGAKPKCPAGSPPQVRGKPFETSTASHSTRITPAGAGKTIIRINFYYLFRDHPRRCGENPPYHNYLFGR